MNAVFVSILICSILPVLSEALRPGTRPARSAATLSPRTEALYRQLWAGPVDPFTLAGHDPGPDEFRAALRVTDGLPAGRPVSHSRRDAADAATWAGHGFREEDIRRSLGRQFNLEWWGKLNSKIVLIDPNANPYTPIRRSGWQTDESLKLPLAGSLFVVGQLRANSGSIEYQQYELVGRTGLGVRLPEWLGGEIQVRGGRSKANYDPDDESMFPGKVTTFLELA